MRKNVIYSFRVYALFYCLGALKGQNVNLNSAVGKRINLQCAERVLKNRWLRMQTRNFKAKNLIFSLKNERKNLPRPF